MNDDPKCATSRDSDNWRKSMTLPILLDSDRRNRLWGIDRDETRLSAWRATMRGAWLFGLVVGMACAGCSTQDNGVVIGCFGLVNQNVPGQDVASNQVVTNLYFGGCSPADNTGMQIVERVTPSAAADPDALAQICNTDCAARITAYGIAHPELQPLTSQLQCQTLFASSCDGISADVTNMSGEAGNFQLGGPADQRFMLQGTVTIKSRPA